MNNVTKVPVMNPSCSLVRRVLTIPGCTQFTVTLQSISCHQKYNILKNIYIQRNKRKKERKQNSALIWKSHILIW